MLGRRLSLRHAHARDGLQAMLKHTQHSHAEQNSHFSMQSNRNTITQTTEHLKNGMHARVCVCRRGVCTCVAERSHKHTHTQHIEGEL